MTGELKKGWTDEQKKAVEEKGANILVAAAAGAGKTSVLVERVLKRICDPWDPVDVDRLLVVTFTKAAASEMKERIARALEAELESGQGGERLKRQLLLLNRASICTLHSFCAEVVRAHFYRLGIDPAFRVADEAESLLLQSYALEEVLNRRFEKSGLAGRLADCWGGGADDAALSRLVLEAFEIARATPDPTSWLKSLAARFAEVGRVPFDGLPWAAELKRAAAARLEKAQALLAAAARLAQSPGGPRVYLNNLEEETRAVGELADAYRRGCAWDDLAAKLAGTELFKKLKPARGDGFSRELAALAREWRGDAKKQVDGLKEGVFAVPAGELEAALKKVAPLAEEFVGLVLDFMEAYWQLKQAKGVLDFGDLEHGALAVLSDESGGRRCPSPVAMAYRERFWEVLVDEYQDINPVQEEILQLVSRQGSGTPNLFSVGDAKQSIYRFRLADPGLFLAKYKAFGEGRGGKRLLLSGNFRSRPQIVDAVNFMFRQIMTPGAAELAYTAEAELVCRSSYPPCPPENPVPVYGPVEVCLIESGQGQNRPPESADRESTAGEEEQEELEAARLEARFIAARIKELVGKTCVLDPGEGRYRPAQYRDIAVLLRSVAGYAGTLAEELRAAGIPVCAEVPGAYFNSVEVMTLLSLLRVIDNPRQDIHLAAVLRSPLVGLDEEDLARVRLALPRAGDFYDAVLEAARREDALGRRLKEFLAQLDGWRTAARRGTVAGLVWSVCRDTGYYDFVGGLPGGSQRQANLRALYHRALLYGGTAFWGLAGFLQFVERLEEEGFDLAAASPVSEKEDAVRVISVHKSKGLEFPVVFLAGLGRKFNLQSLGSRVLFHRELGMGPELVDLECRTVRKTAAWAAVRERLVAETLAEEMRILYVAMTRAREKLVMVGAVRGLAARVAGWCASVWHEGRALPDGVLAAAACPLDWLAPALARHPDGRPMWRAAGLELAGRPPGLLDCKSRWQIYTLDKVPPAGAGFFAGEKLGDRLRHTKPFDPGPYWEDVKARLGWRYPAERISALPAKAAASGVQALFDPPYGYDAQKSEDQGAGSWRVLPRPSFVRGKGLTPEEIGSVVHLVMQCIDLGGRLDEEGIREQVGELVKKEVIAKDLACALPVEEIASFFASPLGLRILKAKSVQREVPFTLAVPADELYAGVTGIGGERVIVQGVIDCLADEGDGLLLIDYKTGERIPAAPSEVPDAYRRQVLLYVRAAEDILGRKVKEAYLYFLRGGTAVKVFGRRDGQLEGASGLL